jgi:hypothetical protein
MLYVLLALNVLLAWSGFVYTGAAVAIGLGYAFAPLLIALLFTELLTKSQADRTDRKAFVRNLEIIWCLTLTVAMLSLILSLKL